MNRGFPGNPRGTVSSRIAHFVKTPNISARRVVIDIHSGGMEELFPTARRFIPSRSGRAGGNRQSLPVGSHGLSADLFEARWASGLLTDEAEAEGKVTIGSELGAGASTDRLGVRHAYEGTKNVLRITDCSMARSSRSARPARRPRD